MRNRGTDESLEKDVNTKSKTFVKSPSQKESIFCKIIDVGSEKDRNKKEIQQKLIDKNCLLSKNGQTMVDAAKSIKDKLSHYQRSFLYSEKVKQSAENKSFKDDTTKNEKFRENNINDKSLSVGNKHKLISTKESNSSDSRVTGGGSLKDDLSDNPIHKRIHKENSATRRVSFKVRHPIAMHRKNPATEITVTTITSSKVAALTQKFNDLIKENDSLLKEPKLAKVVDRIHSCRNKNNESNSSTPNSMISSNVSVKILTNSKVLLKRKGSLKSKSDSLDKLHKLDSPSTQRKVIRVKSENTPKKKSTVKRKEIYKKMELSHSERYNNFRDIRDKYNKNDDSTDDCKTSNPVRRKPSIKNSSSRNSIDVKAAIKIFESQKKPDSATDKTSTLKSKDKSSSKPKPDVPAKKVHLFSNKNIVVVDGIPKMKVVKSSSGSKLNNSDKDCSGHENNNEEIKEKATLDKSEKNAFPERTDSSKKSVKLLYYDKINFRHKTVHPDKLHRPISKTCEIDANELLTGKESCSSLDTLNSSKTDLTSDTAKQEEDSGVSLTDHEKLYQEVSSRIKPNESFLWRSNSKINTTESDEYDINLVENIYNTESKSESTYIMENEYDYVGPPIVTESKNLMECIAEELDSPTFESFIKKADDLLEIKKREIADDLRKESRNPEPLTEAINLYVKNSDEDLNNISESINIPVILEVMKNEEEKLEKKSDGDYEPLESFRTDEQKSVYSYKEYKSLPVRNGPLPQLPHEVNTSYSSLRESRTIDDNASLHTYEYCPSKIDPEKCSKVEKDQEYEYCKSPRENETDTINEKKIVENMNITKNKSSLYERIPSTKPRESLYETIPSDRSSTESKNTRRDQTYGENYDECNCDENIYDTIKQPDSVSNCYESIPGSPHSVIRMKQKGNMAYDPRSILLKRMSFDTISNFSQVSSISTVISENKTNSIYGQRSIMSFERSDITTVYGESPSEISSSDRSDEWVDMSDQDESSEDPTIIIIREKVRKTRRSPASWSRKVKKWNVSPKKNDFTVFVSSPSIVYITTSHSVPYYSDNDKVFCGEELYQNVDAMLRLLKDNKLHRCDFAGMAIMKVQSAESDVTETQEICLLIDTDSSDKEHLYESLSHSQNISLDLNHQVTPYVDDFDSFDSDSDIENHKFQKNELDIHNTQLPDPPTSSNIYTLTKFANAAGKKMRQLKSNFTKSTRKKPNTGEDKSLNMSDESKDKKSKKWSIKENNKTSQYASHNAINTVQDVKNNKHSSNTNQHPPFSESTNSQYPVRNAVSNINLTNADKLNLELATALSDRKLKSDNSSESVNNMSPNTSSDVSISPVTNSKTEKESQMLSRKYLSFKTKFKRNSSLIETNSRSLSLSLTNSVFYLNDIDDSSLHKSDSQLSSIENGNKDDSINVNNSSTKSKKRESLEKAPSIESSPSNGSITKTSPNNNRKSITSIKTVKSRPSAPPPPPPTENITNGDKKGILKKDKRTNSTSSWYAECGLFKAAEPYKPETNGQANERKSSSSWYSEVGLYQVGNISISSSSGCSSTGGTSITTAPSPLPPHPGGMFTQEPLYQFYNAAKLESVCRISKDSDLESDGYEEIANFRESQQANNKTYQRPSAMALINPQKGPSRTLWCEIPEVINSRILDTMATSKKKLQEAMFEIITSEASYLNSLTVLESQFMSHPSFLDNSIISDADKKNLFGNVLPVKHCSEQLMGDLEQCWQDNILLRGLCNILYNHAEKYFHVYVKYCESQVFLIKALKKLKQDDKFHMTLQQIQSKPECQGLSLHSFLMLPMQRITRLPLLMDAVLKNLEKSDDEYQSCLNALAMLNTVVSQCNEGARKTERLDEMTNIAKKIEFPPHIKKIPIILASSEINANKTERWLVRSGELTQLVWRGDEQSKLTFGKKFTKISLHLFLFTDLLIITKRKSDESYMVIDYCKRSLLELTTNDMLGQAPIKETAGKHVVLLTMLENCENKTVEMLLSCVSESDRQRWMEACLPPPSDNPNETIYEGWDCPQVAAIYPYQTQQPDELALRQGDIINVTNKMVDGWHHGERISDGEKGWFPGNHTVEIASQHVRAKNLRQRYRLLALTGTYLGQKKK